MIQVRKIQPKDLELLYQNSEELGFDKSIMTDKLEHMMLISNGDKLCGIGCGILIEEKCLLNWIYIAKHFRRDRMGTALVKTIMNNAELKGAKTAYIKGSCDKFAEFLKFDVLAAAEELKEIEGLYTSVYREEEHLKLYKVSLIDYFKPCSCKK